MAIYVSDFAGWRDGKSIDRVSFVLFLGRVDCVDVERMDGRMIYP